MPRLQWTLRFSLVGLARIAALLALVLCLPAGAGRGSRQRSDLLLWPAPLTLERVAAAAPGASTEAHLEGHRIRITVAWPDVTLVITVDPASSGDVQLLGMRNWIGKFGPVHRNTPSAKASWPIWTAPPRAMAPSSRPLRCGRKGRSHARAVAEAGGRLLLRASVLLQFDRQQDMGIPGDPQRLGPPPRHQHNLEPPGPDALQTLRGPGWPVGTGEFAMRRIRLALAGLATLLASPAALAADADVLRQFGMQGRVALNCGAPYSQSNPHVIYGVSPQGAITRTLRMTPDLDGTFPMRNLRMLSPTTMQFDETGRQSSSPSPSPRSTASSAAGARCAPTARSSSPTASSPTAAVPRKPSRSATTNPGRRAAAPAPLPSGERT